MFCRLPALRLPGSAVVLLLIGVGFCRAQERSRPEPVGPDQVSTIVYPIGELFPRWEADELIRVVKALVAPESWGQPGGQRAIAFRGKTSFVVTQDERAHRLIAQLLERLGRIRDDNPAGLSSGEQKIEKALKSPTQLEFIQMPLTDVVAYLKKRHEMDIRGDAKAFNDAGLRVDTPITIVLRRLSLRPALDLMLQDLDCVAVVQNDALVITTREAAARQSIVRAYPLKTFLGLDSLTDRDVRRFADVVRTCVQPDAWAGSGGKGTIATLGGADKSLLLVVQTYAFQEEIAALLDMFRRRGEPTPAERKILGQFDTLSQVKFIETPLQTVADDLRDYHDIEIQLDKRRLDDIGVGCCSPFTCNLRNVTLRSVLRLVFSQQDMTYLVRDDVLLLTTAEGAEARWYAGVYFVDDLKQIDCDSLAKTIRKAIAPTSWAESGGKGVIMRAFDDGPKCFVVRQTFATHERLSEMLRCLRVVAGTGTKEVAQEPPEEKIRRTLQWPTSADFLKTPLRDVLGYFEGDRRIEIEIDPKARADAWISGDAPVTVRFEKVPLRDALEQMLGKPNLTFIVRDEVLQITTPKVAESWVSTQVYSLSAEKEQEIVQRWKRLDPDLLVPLGGRKALVAELTYEGHEKVVKVLGPPVPRLRIKRVD